MTDQTKRPSQPPAIGPTEPPPDPPGVAPGDEEEDDRDPESDDEPTHPHAPHRGGRRSLIPSPDLAVEIIKDQYDGGSYGSTRKLNWRDMSLLIT